MPFKYKNHKTKRLPETKLETESEAQLPEISGLSLSDWTETGKIRIGLPISSGPENLPRLLALPSELRNQVYEYVLTAPDGLFTWPSSLDFAESNSPVKFWAASDSDTQREYNQLRYVCRQFYHETSGLLLKFNKFTFLGSSDTGLDNKMASLKYAEYFLEQCSPSAQALIRRITIHEGEKPKSWIPPELSQFIVALGKSSINAFCKRQPHIEVTIRLDNFSPGLRSWWWILQGSPIQMALRGHVPDFLDPRTAEAFTHAGISIREEMKEPISSNLRIFPAGPFHEQAFRDTHPPRPQAAFEAWVALARKWCEEGF